MFYRRKIILNLLNSFGGELKSLRLQKLLFLFCQDQEKPNFDFVPYKYGCFSLQSYADLRTMEKYGQIQGNEKSWKIADAKVIQEAELKPFDSIKLMKLKSQFGKMSAFELITYVYSRYPYYAINSEVAERYLDKQDLNRIDKERLRPNGKSINTVGYEGVSIDAYLNLLIKEGVQILADVRKNSLSMKYGFSRNQLKSSTEKLGIEYRHYPQLGIVSSKRQNLEIQADYDRLFKEYEKSVIPNQTDTLEEIAHIAQAGKRIAFTCFESSPQKCHRTRVANAVANLIPDFNIKHL